MIDINTFLNYGLVETNGAIWCTFTEIKRLFYM